MPTATVLPTLAPEQRATPDEVARYRAIAEALLAQSQSGKPVEHWTQGVNQILQALMGGLNQRQANKLQREGEARGWEFLESMPGLYGGGGYGGGAPSTGAGETAETPNMEAVSSTGDDADMIIRTVIGEAAGEPPVGQQAVASVIMNRARQSGMTPSQVVLAKGQFEPWGSRGRQLRAIDPSSEQYRRVAANVLPVLQGQAPDPTGGATHFYAPRAQAALGRSTPSWARGPGQDIGNHRFYALGYGGGGRHGIPGETADIPDAEPVGSAPSPDVMRHITGGGAQPAGIRLSPGQVGGSVIPAPVPRPRPSVPPQYMPSTTPPPLGATYAPQPVPPPAPADPRIAAALDATTSTYPQPVPPPRPLQDMFPARQRPVPPPAPLTPVPPPSPVPLQSMPRTAPPPLAATYAPRAVPPPAAADPRIAAALDTTTSTYPQPVRAPAPLQPAAPPIPLQDMFPARQRPLPPPAPLTPVPPPAPADPRIAAALDATTSAYPQPVRSTYTSRPVPPPAPLTPAPPPLSLQDMYPARQRPVPPPAPLAPVPPPAPLTPKEQPVFGGTSAYLPPGIPEEAYGTVPPQIRRADASAYLPPGVPEAQSRRPLPPPYDALNDPLSSIRAPAAPAAPAAVPPAPLAARAPQPRPAPPVAPAAPATTGAVAAAQPGRAVYPSMAKNDYNAMPGRPPAAMPMRPGQLMQEPYSGPMSAQDFARLAPAALRSRRAGQPAPAAGAPVEPRRGLLQALLGRGGTPGAAAAPAAPAGSPVAPGRAGIAAALQDISFLPPAVQGIALKRMFETGERPPDYTIKGTRFSGITNQPIASVPDEPEKPADYTLDKTRFSGVTNEPIASVPGDPPKREIREDANGIPRYVDTSEPVFGSDTAGGQAPVKITDVAGMRKEIQGLDSYKRYEKAAPVFNSLAESYGKNTRAGDLDFIYAMATIFDPESVVREGEQILVRNTANLPDQVVNGISSLMSGTGQLDGETRRNLYDVVHGRMQQYREAADNALAPFPAIAERWGINPADIMPTPLELKALPEVEPAAAAGSSRDNPARPATEADIETLPSGTYYVAPDGSIRRRR